MSNYFFCRGNYEQMSGNKSLTPKNDNPYPKLDLCQGARRYHVFLRYL